MLKDRFGRPITSLRISITQRCNFSCLYCHREGSKGSEDREMTPEEIERVVRVGARLGVRKVKLTGGEPLLRQDVCEVVRRLSGVEGVREVSMTTNGYLLADYAEELAEAGLKRVNVSLDTTDPEKFRWLTGGMRVERVLSGIEAALEAGLKPVKINMVVMRDVNHEEVLGMLRRFSGTDTVLQLIELVPGNGEFFRRYFYDLDLLEGEIARRARVVRRRRFMHLRAQYQLNGSRVEFVKPMHNSQFCAHCTRLRITADGKFKPCLMRNDNLIDFLTPMRSGAGDEELERLFRLAVGEREPFFR